VIVEAMPDRLRALVLLCAWCALRSGEVAREAAGRPDSRGHHLRHTGATMAARAEATLAELQERLGHSSVNATLRYQHAARAETRRSPLLCPRW
jgi:site-specific recombinase XerD